MNEKTKNLLDQSTAVAQNAAKMIGGTFTQGVGFSPITSEALGANEASINLPTPTPPSTTGAAISARNLSSVEQAKAGLDAEEQAYKEQVKSRADTSGSKIKELFGLQQKAFDDKIAGYSSEEFKALKELKTKALNDQISLRKAQDAEIKAINDQSMLTDVQKQQKFSELNNRYAFQSAQLSLTSSIASNNFQSAKQDIDDMYTLTMEKYTPQINYYSQLAQNDQKIFNDAEVKILENKRDEYKAIQTTQSDNVKANGEAMIKYNSMGAGITINDTAEQRASKIAAVGGDIGYEIYKNKKTSGGTIPTIKSINGVDMQWNPATGKWETITTETKQSETLQQAQAQGNIDTINNLLTDKNIRSAVGPTGIARFVGRGWDALTGGRQNFIASVEQVRSNLNLEALIGAKARGATFGALSNQELQVLASAATKIGTWAIADRNEQGDIVGNVKGYSASEKDFKKELDKINNFAKLDYVRKGGVPEDVGGVLMTDGNYYVLNSDGTYTQLTN